MGEAACNVLGDTIDSICSGLDKDCDDRETIEKPATEWIFSCPKLQWLDEAAEKSQTNIWSYQFRAAMPLGLNYSNINRFKKLLDISKVGGDDSWEDYERCEALSCHASELSYEFSVEKTLNCPSLAKDKGEMVSCQVRLGHQTWALCSYLGKW